MLDLKSQIDKFASYFTVYGQTGQPEKHWLSRGVQLAASQSTHPGGENVPNFVLVHWEVCLVDAAIVLRVLFSPLPLWPGRQTQPSTQLEMPTVI